jgi:PKD repeat protein
LTIDTTPPSTPILNTFVTTTSARPALTWLASSDATSGVDAYAVTVDGTSVGTVSATACSSGNCHFTPPSAISDGAHTWVVTAADNAGNSARSTTASFIVAVPPSAKIGSVGQVETGQAVVFSAGASSDTNSNLVDYAWDFDGSASYATDSGAASSTIHTFTAPGTYVVDLHVRDAAGLSAATSETVNVVLAPPAGYVGVSINNGDFATDSRAVTLDLVWPVGATSVLISNDGGFNSAGATKESPLAPAVAWTLNQPTNEGLSRTVYVRFLGASQDLVTFTDDIVLDTTAPSISSAAILSDGGQQRSALARASHARKAPAPLAYTVSLHAADSQSGISSVAFSSRAGGTAVNVTLRSLRVRGFTILSKAVVVRASFFPRFVRVRNAAGKWSPWKAIQALR